MLITKNTYLTLCGQLLKPCGMVLLNAGCMANNYNNWILSEYLKTCQLKQVQEYIEEKNPDIGTSFQCTSQHHVNVTRVKRLFVAAEVDDTHLYHVITEIMPRLIQHLDFLRANPDVQILYGCDSRPDPKQTQIALNIGLRNMKPLMKMVGLNPDRLILHSDIYADEVYLPMEGACQDPVYNTWSILKLRKLLIETTMQASESNQALKNTIQRISSSSDHRPVMTLIKRSWSKFTRNKRDNIRQWNEAFGFNLTTALQIAFPQYRVLLYSDTDEEVMNCMQCQIYWASISDVLIGVHGAGLTQQLFMKPNSAIVEIGHYANDGRLMLGGGPFSRLATLLSHDYLLHYAEFGVETTMIFRERVSYFNITNFVQHLDSFLHSIGKI